MTVLAQGDLSMLANRAAQHQEWQMPVNRYSEFQFCQYLMQDDGGWCGGISVAVITHLYENLATGLQYISTSNAFSQTKGYVSLLRASYNKASGNILHGASSFRDSIADVQKPFNYGGGSGAISGPYEYDFSTSGTALLRINVEKTSGKQYGTHFDSKWSVFSGDANHAGVAVWDPAKVSFVFDPNVGGVLFKWAPCDVVPSFPAAIDKALRHMYKHYDRERGGRTAKTVAAIRLDRNSALPFGKV